MIAYWYGDLLPSMLCLMIERVYRVGKAGVGAGVGGKTGGGGFRSISSSEIFIWYCNVRGMAYRVTFDW